MEDSTEYCIVFHFHQPPYDKDTISYYDECYEQSYKFHLNVLDSFPSLRVNFNITGTLLEMMKKRNPKFIKRLEKKVDSGQIYLTACGYNHPIFPIILERLGKEACEMQVERDLKIKKKLFGVEPKVFRLPEYAVSEDVVNFLYDSGFEGTIIPDVIFSQKGIDTNNSLEHDMRMVPRNDDLSNALACGYFKGNNYSKWLADDGTPEMVAKDFAGRIKSEQRVLTDCDGETYYHWLNYIPEDKKHILEAVYSSILSNGIKTMHLPEFIDFAVPRKTDSIPRVSYDGNGLSVWEGKPEHEQMWRDIETCWKKYLESDGDKIIMKFAMNAQTSCFAWAVTHGYSSWWAGQPGEYKKKILSHLQNIKAQKR